MRTFVAAAALAVAGLLAAGCSSAPAPAASHTAGAAATGADTKPLYISCLVSHGVHIPGPGAGHNGGGVNRNSPQFRRAEHACRSLQPRGEPEVITATDQTDYLRAAQCVRAHGVPQFPDPVFANGGVHFPVPRGLDIHTPQVQRAVAICRRLIPPGLPYSG